MKKSINLFTLLALLFISAFSFAEELGLKTTNLNLYAAANKEKNHLLMESIKD